MYHLSIPSLRLHFSPPPPRPRYQYLVDALEFSRHNSTPRHLLQHTRGTQGSTAPLGPSPSSWNPVSSGSSRRTREKGWETGRERGGGGGEGSDVGKGREESGREPSSARFISGTRFEGKFCGAEEMEGRGNTTSEEGEKLGGRVARAPALLLDKRKPDEGGVEREEKEERSKGGFKGGEPAGPRSPKGPSSYSLPLFASPSPVSASSFRSRYERGEARGGRWAGELSAGGGKEAGDGPWEGRGEERGKGARKRSGGRRGGGRGRGGSQSGGGPASFPLAIPASIYRQSQLPFIPPSSTSSQKYPSTSSWLPTTPPRPLVHEPRPLCPPASLTPPPSSPAFPIHRPHLNAPAAPPTAVLVSSPSGSTRRPASLSNSLTSPSSPPSLAANVGPTNVASIGRGLGGGEKVEGIGEREDSVGNEWAPPKVLEAKTERRDGARRDARRGKKAGWSGMAGV